MVNLELKFFFTRLNKVFRFWRVFFFFWRSKPIFNVGKNLFCCSALVRTLLWTISQCGSHWSSPVSHNPCHENSPIDLFDIGRCTDGSEADLMLKEYNPWPRKKTQEILQSTKNTACYLTNQVDPGQATPNVSDSRRHS